MDVEADSSIRFFLGNFEQGPGEERIFPQMVVVNHPHTARTRAQQLPFDGSYRNVGVTRLIAVNREVIDFTDNRQADTNSKARALFFEPLCECFGAAGSARNKPYLVKIREVSAEGFDTKFHHLGYPTGVEVVVDYGDTDGVFGRYHPFSNPAQKTRSRDC